MSVERTSGTDENIEPLNKSSEHSDPSAKFAQQLFKEPQTKSASKENETLIASNELSVSERKAQNNGYIIAKPINYGSSTPAYTEQSTNNNSASAETRTQKDAQTPENIKPEDRNPIKPTILPDGTELYPYGENGKRFVKPDGTKIIETLDSKGNTIQQFSFGISQGPTRIIYKDQPITLERVKTHDDGRADSWFKDGKLYQTDFYNKQGKKIIIDTHLPNKDIEQTYPDSPGAFKIIHPDGSIYEKIVTNSGSRTRMLDKNGKELPPMPPAPRPAPLLSQPSLNEQSSSKPEAKTAPLPEIKITPNTTAEAPAATHNASPKNEKPPTAKEVKATTSIQSLAEIRSAIIKTADSVKSTIIKTAQQAKVSQDAKAATAQITTATEVVTLPLIDTNLSPTLTDKQSPPSAEAAEQPFVIPTDLSLNSPAGTNQDAAQTKMLDSERIAINTKITDDDLQRLIDLSKANNIKAITITPEADLTSVTQKGIALLSQLDKLEELHINNVSLDDSWLIAMKDLNQLKTLSISGKDISGVGLAHLKYLKGLTSLDLSASDISDKELDYISDLSDLRNLNLSHTLITNEGLASVKKLSNLSSLNLNNTKVDDVGLWHLRNLDKIHTLEINNTQTTERGFPNLANLPNLTSLFYDHNVYEDKKLKELIIPDITAG